MSMKFKTVQKGAGQNLRRKEHEIQIRLKKRNISNREINKFA